ncbi:MAG: KH domain-containing protein [Candidatus Marinimicrobia bacterium]|nr:KH domain-containing protein [Candidatus Neomarinimicrobiota bacterium]MCK4295397.1 KH domain-containing protein [Candidatus Neomarinimicrobiota bacterium]
MKDFIKYIVEKLVDNPDEVKVTQVDSEKTIILELSVKEGDLGKVIGKKGRTAKALRTLLTAAAAKQGQKRAILEIIE